MDGIDAACKVVILANAILGMDAKLADVKVTGIRNVTPEVTKLARETGYTVKLVGVAKPDLLEVAPKLVPLGHPLAVGGTLNAVTLEMDLAREISITGFGAGPRETASALIGDMISIHRSVGAR